MAEHRFQPLQAARIGTLALLLLAPGLLFGALPAAEAAPDPTKKKSAGPTFRNKSLGVSARTPSGWKLIADKAPGP